MSLIDDLIAMDGLLIVEPDGCDVCERINGKCIRNCFAAGMQIVAASLSEQGYVKKSELEAEGYVKVVRCGECVHWGGNRKEHLQECPVCARWLEEDGEALCYGHFIENMGGVMMKAEDFCPYGVRLVAKSATTENVVPAPEKAE